LLPGCDRIRDSDRVAGPSCKRSIRIPCLRRKLAKRSGCPWPQFVNVEEGADRKSSTVAGRKARTRQSSYSGATGILPAPNPRKGTQFLEQSNQRRFRVLSKLCRMAATYRSRRGEMQSLKLVLAAAGVVGAGIFATTDLAGAKDYVLTAADCVPPPAPLRRWYYRYYLNDLAPNWEPFFRRHVDKYGPIVVCPVIATPPVISSRY
jgi:hypothetical protein